MKRYDRRNRQEQQFVKNSRIIFTLPLNGKIPNGKVILTGNVGLAAGAASGVKKGEGGPVNLIRRITVFATPAAGSRYPGGKVVDCTPRSLLNYAIFQRGKFVAEQAASTLGNGAIGVYPIYLSIPIYFADDQLRRFLATSLNADPTAYQSIQVQVDTGTIQDCFTGNDRTEDYSGLKVQWVDDRRDIAGDTYCLFQEDHAYLIPAAQERAIDKAMPQDGAFLQWLIMSENTAALTLADTILQKVNIAGDQIDYDKYAQDIKQQMIDDAWVDASQSIVGLHFIDFADGSVGNAIAAGSLDVKFKVANPGGANLDDLFIYTRRVFAPASMQ